MSNPASTLPRNSLPLLAGLVAVALVGLAWAVVSPSTLLLLPMLLLGAVSLLNTRVGAYLLALTAPLEDVLYVELGGTKVKLYEGVLLGLALGLLLRRPRVRLDAFALALGAYAAYGVVTIIYSVATRDTLQTILFEGIMVLVALTMRRSIKDAAQLRRLTLFTVLVVGGSVTLYGLAQFVGYYLGFDIPFFAPGLYPIFRPYSTFKEPNFLGNFLASMLVLALVLYISPAFRRWRQPFILLISVGLPVLVLNWSRGPWLALVAGAGVYALVTVRTRRGFQRVVLLAAIPVVLFGVTLGAFYFTGSGAWSAITQRLVHTLNPLSEGAASDRLADIQLSLQLWSKHPIIGNGVGSWGAAAYGLSGDEVRTPPRNIFVAWLFERGVVGTALALWLYGLLVWKTVRAYRRSRDEQMRALLLGLGLSVLVVFITFQFTRLDISPFYWVQMGLLLAALRLSSTQAGKA